MKFRQIPVTSISQVPEGFRREPGLLKREITRDGAFNKLPVQVQNEIRLYRHALDLARAGRMPSFKLMSSTSSRGGPVFLPADWREQTVRILAANKFGRKCQLPEVQRLRELATSAAKPAASMSTSHTDVVEMQPAEPSPTVKAGQGVQALIDLRDLSERHLQMQERIAQQNAELLATMRSLLAVWSAPTVNA